MMKLAERIRRSSPRYYRSILLPCILLGGLLIFTLVVEVVLSLNTRGYVVPANKQISQLVRLQSTNLELQRELIESLREDSEFTTAERDRIHEELKNILRIEAHLVDATPQALAQARDVLADATYHPKEALLFAFSHTRKAVDLELRAHQQLIEGVDRASLLKFRIAILSLLVFPAGAGLIIYALRHRILLPLRHLGTLMTLLARQDYSPAPVAAIDPMLRPLVVNYNAMVQRLAAFEQEHASREHELESQVQNATDTLLEQQCKLASTERLTAVAESMAHVAHELRNPLAGIKLACANLRQDLSRMAESTDYVKRLDTVGAEIDRIVAALNSLLDQSRHQPPPLRDIAVARTVAEVITLLRYQIPARIRLEQRIADNIMCNLPDALLRPALLNLILNARQSIGEHDGEIVVDAFVNAETLVLSVCDDGPGFHELMLRTGFRAYVTDRPGGTGLGLPMVQRFARNLGGDVSLSNLKPHGACVTLELPGANIDGSIATAPIAAAAFKSGTR